jgi:hypothetical protein
LRSIQNICTYYEEYLPIDLFPYRNRTKKLITLSASDHALNANKKCGEELWTAACRPGVSVGNGAINHSILPPSTPRAHSSRRSLKQNSRPARPLPSPETDSTLLAYLYTGLVDISGDATQLHYGNAGLPGHTHSLCLVPGRGEGKYEN